jgi:hypothetical protein
VCGGIWDSSPTTKKFNILGSLFGALCHVRIQFKTGPLKVCNMSMASHASHDVLDIFTVDSGINYLIDSGGSPQKGKHKEPCLG